jgi:hypothetical protein
MDAVEIIVRHIKRDRRAIFELGETGEAALLHPKRKVLPLDIGR